MRTKSP
jgi:hypothetical protein